MFTPLDYDLNTAYRTRKMETARKARQSEAKQDRRTWVVSTRLSSFTWIISLMVISAIVFGFSIDTVHAQETFTDGSESSSPFGPNYLYLRSAIHAIHADDLDSARDYLAYTLDDNPEFAPAYTTLAFIAILEGENDEALDYALTAYEIYAVDPAMTFMVAEAYYANETCELAVEYFNLYLTQVSEQEYQPVLVTALLNSDSLPLVVERMAECEAESLS